MNRKETFLQKGWVVGLLAMVCCFLWGSAFPCVKIGYEMFSIGDTETASQILFAGLRFFLAGVLAIAGGSIASRTFLFPQKTSWGMVLKVSLAQTVAQYLFFYIGLANTSGVKGSIIVASNTFLSICISCLIFHYEKLSRNKVLGCLVGFLGVVIINLSGGEIGGGVSFIGEGFMFLSTLSNAISVSLVKGYGKRENPVVLSGYQFLLGGLVMILFGLARGGRVQVQSAWAVLLLIYMAMISAVAYTIWSILLKFNPVARVQINGFMTPLFGVVLSAVLLQEKNQAFTLQGLVSLLLVCLGIWIVNYQKAPRKAEKISA